MLSPIQHTARLMLFAVVLFFMLRVTSCCLESPPVVLVAELHSRCADVVESTCCAMH